MPRKIRSTETPAALPVRVKVFGPNLSSAAQRKGTFHVHTANCADNAHYGPGRKYGGEDRGFTLTVTSRLEIVQDLYAEIMSDTMDPADATPADWDSLDDLYLAPCVQFGTARIDPTLTRKRRDEIIEQVANEIVEVAQAEGMTASVKPAASAARWARVATAHYVFGHFTARATGHNEWTLTHRATTVATKLPRLQACKDLALSINLDEIKAENGEGNSPAARRRRDDSADLARHTTQKTGTALRRSEGAKRSQPARKAERERKANLAARAAVSELGINPDAMPSAFTATATTTKRGRMITIRDASGKKTGQRESESMHYVEVQIDSRGRVIRASQKIGGTGRAPRHARILRVQESA